MSFPKTMKGELLPSSMPDPALQKKSRRLVICVAHGTFLLFAFFTCLYSFGFVRVPSCWSDYALEANPAQCPQVSSLVPEKNAELWNSLGETYETDAFVTRAVGWLGGAVRVPTQSYDKMQPVGVDPRWEVFGPFHDYLLTAFPQVHATLELTKVNTYGLVYVWKGSDVSLKPLLLAAHQDVVPVNPDTADEWAHPPFSVMDAPGERIWGRGSSDDKSGLIGVLSSIETLLERGFQPTRSVVLAFGFDEEASGIYGASAIGKYLLSTYGENAFFMLVDEGGGFSQEFGGVFATPAIAEKGYIDVRVEVTSPGGHSSIPPSHTTIGILAALLVHYESNPYEAKLARDTPMYWKAQCIAEHAPLLSSYVRKAIKRSTKSDRALRTAEEALFADPVFKAFVGTTQAIDLIDGGVKTNALPELAWAVVNHRVATDSSVDVVKEHDTNLLKSLASDFNLSYTAFGTSVSTQDAPAYGTLTLSDAWGAALEPAPITPIGADAVPYQLLSGTIKAAYNAHRSLLGDNIVVAPGIMSGNTGVYTILLGVDPHIFRYNHHNAGTGNSLSGVHTVNESISADAFIEMIRFFTTLILNADESTA
ncbi:Carboxypeptidase S [Grifola frondosa]|uniref:Carboxypeptidase S n=1 Tax=Grifola frondosa TaxID=5627 RepID=A0A1C7MB27_GRIFR|nr:Carboxypeptidase S [Grifola frondosa]